MNKKSTEARSVPKLSRTEEDILAILSVRPSYGLEIAKVIESATQGDRILNAGTLYPALRKLEELGLVESYWGDELDGNLGARRRYYRLEPQGREVFEYLQQVRASLLKW